MNNILDIILNFVNDLGYVGLFFAMVLNGSLLPIPSEVFIIPAGYLASKGGFNLLLVIFSGTFGSLCGSIINYFIGYKIGRPFFFKYGKFLKIKEDALNRGEKWFRKYGIYAVFFTRFAPTIRQYITIIPGILKMNLINFMLFSLLGDIFVVSFLTFLGYFFGEYRNVIKPYLNEIYITFISLFIISTIIYMYYIYYSKRKKRVKN